MLPHGTRFSCKREEIRRYHHTLVYAYRDIRLPPTFRGYRGAHAVSDPYAGQSCSPKVLGNVPWSPIYAPGGDPQVITGATGSCRTGDWRYSSSPSPLPSEFFNAPQGHPPDAIPLFAVRVPCMWARPQHALPTPLGSVLVAYGTPSPTKVSLVSSLSIFSGIRRLNWHYFKVMGCLVVGSRVVATT